MLVTTIVVLPEWIWDQSKDKEEFKSNLKHYMRNYKGYRIIKVEKYYAICDTGR